MTAQKSGFTLFTSTRVNKPCTITQSNCSKCTYPHKLRRKNEKNTYCHSDAFFAAGLSFGQNLLNDSSFESGNLSTWNLTGDSADCYAEKTKAMRIQENGATTTGKNSIHGFTRQKITGLSNGTYKLSVWSMGGGGENAIKLFARGFDNSGKEISAQIKNTGWKKWKQYSIEIPVQNGEVEIGIFVDANKENWGNLDDIELVKLN